MLKVVKYVETNPNGAPTRVLDIGAHKSAIISPDRHHSVLGGAVTAYNPFIYPDLTITSDAMLHTDPVTQVNRFTVSIYDGSAVSPRDDLLAFHSLLPTWKAALGHE